MSGDYNPAKLIGMKLSDAEAYAKSIDRSIRPVRINGEPQYVFHTYIPDRINVEISRTEAGDFITAYRGDG